MIGRRLGPYEVVAKLGEGGMGEVYRAKDTRLDRTVAVKILSLAGAADPEFRARFDREARAISQLNHPNICTLHDVGDHDGTAYLVMEHLEGETLADRLKKGPIALPQALAIAGEIANALDRAHRAGIVHRDLKPGNVMLTKSGSKLLDFGLAKLGAQTAPAPLETRLLTSPPPTSANPITTRGTILGTFQYMAPEQIEGQEADTRSDIWAYGCVLYEMITGRRAFEGKTQASLVGAILERQPTPLMEMPDAAAGGRLRPARGAESPSASEWGWGPASIKELDRLVRTCLAKDPDNRFQNIRDVGLQLEWIAEGDTQSAVALTGVQQSPRGRAVWAGVALAGIAITAVATWFIKPAPAIAPGVVSRFTVQAPGDQRMDGPVAISPDGTRVAYTSNRQLYVRFMNQPEAQLIRTASDNPTNLAFSPDGQWIAYFARGDPRSSGAREIRKILIAGGSADRVCEVPVAPQHLSWRGNTIVFDVSGDDTVIYAVSDSGGAARPIVSADVTKGESVWHAELTPDGKHVLTTFADKADREFRIVAYSLATGARHTVHKRAYDSQLLPTGYLVYRSSRRLFGVALDMKHLESRGEPVILVEGVGAYGVSENGTLAYVPTPVENARQPNTLAWVDRQGQEQPLAAKPRAYAFPRISPDGSQIVVDSADEERDLWVWSIPSTTLSRLTFTKDVGERVPVWTRDGRRVIYRAEMSEGARILGRRVDGTGTEETLTKTASSSLRPYSISPDGRLLIYRDSVDKTGSGLFVLPLGTPGSPKEVIRSSTQIESGEVSPDGRWIAFEARESGNETNIFVRPFPLTNTGNWQVSTGGGWGPMWSRNGGELFYRSARDFLSVAVTSPPGVGAFTYSAPKVLFPFTPYLFNTPRTYDISLDGQRFLMVKSGTPQSGPPSSIIVVSNWFDEVRARVKGK